MKVNDTTRRALAYRRQRRDLQARGYEHLDGPWEILRGYRGREIITDVVIDTNGKGVYVKTEEVEGPSVGHRRGLAEEIGSGTRRPGQSQTAYSQSERNTPLAGEPLFGFGDITQVGQLK